MRKATLVAGIISGMVILLGLYLKISGIQPHGGCVQIGFLLLWLGYLPMLLIYRLKNDKTGFQKFASIFGFAVMWAILFPGMFFTIQHIPGGVVLSFMGIPLTIIFLVLFLVSRIKAGEQSAVMGPFSIVTIVIILAMFGGKEIIRAQWNDETEKKVVNYEALLKDEKNLDESNSMMVENFLSNEKDSVELNQAQVFEKHVSDMINYLQEIKGELVAENTRMGLTNEEAETLSVRLIYRPDDYDTPTHFMIGSDPANVTGKAKELKEKLTEFRSIIPASIKSDIDLSDVHIPDREEMLPWEWANFYHATIIDVLSVLTKLQTSILNTEKEAFDKKIFQ